MEFNERAFFTNYPPAEQAELADWARELAATGKPWGICLCCRHESYEVPFLSEREQSCQNCGKRAIYGVGRIIALAVELEVEQQAADEHDRQARAEALADAEGQPVPGQSYLRPDGTTRRYTLFDNLCSACGLRQHWEPCEHCDDLGRD